MNNLPQYSGDGHLRIALPRLQSIIRYYDDFSDQELSIRSPEQDDQWQLPFDGKNHGLDFACFEVDIRPLIKRFVSQK
jgi:hypothetical protein